MRRPTQCDAKAQRQERVLEQIALGARQCEELERQTGETRTPELEEIIKLHRRLVMRFSLEAEVAPEMLKLVKDLMGPLMEWARLEEQRKKQDLAEQKYRDQLEAEKAARAREAKEGAGQGALSPETLEKIERELKLL